MSGVRRATVLCVKAFATSAVIMIRMNGCACANGCTRTAQTNNPRKIAVLEELGVVVTERIPCLVQAQQHSLGYLTTKQARRGAAARQLSAGAQSLTSAARLHGIQPCLLG